MNSKIKVQRLVSKLMCQLSINLANINPIITISREYLKAKMKKLNNRGQLYSKNNRGLKLEK